MYSIGHILKGTLAPALLALMLACPLFGDASADTPNQEIADPRQALDFVDGLAAQAYEILNDASLQDAERDERFRTLLDRGFNTRYIALLALGRYGKGLNGPVLAEYESKFDSFLLGKYLSLIESYGVARFRTVQAERAGRRDVLVHIIIDRPGGSIDTEWRVRMFDGEPRIIDVSVAGLSLTQSERAEFAALIKQSGLEGLLSTLGSYSGAKRV